ncbi:MAG TPA: ChbG/HpnK family deacetylase [Armatimonadetes bacterium]|nr:ChbG/HpnK family deacetylase [Armatimonadota bacterium]
MTRREWLKFGFGALVGTVSVMRWERAFAGTSNSIASMLGYQADDRLLIIHADDVGMCHSVNAATVRTLENGIVTCGSVMVPCPWFPEIAEWAREHPDADLGLHLTLTSEWRYYRWRPVAPIEKVKGLVDDEGFMWRSVEEVVQHASAQEVEIELRAQIERALKFGMKPTHMDSHMGTLFATPEYFEVYVRLGKEYGIIPMLLKPTPKIYKLAKRLGLDYAVLLPTLNKAVEQGYILLDDLVLGVEGDTYEERKAQYYNIIENLEPGVTEIIVHLSGDDEEIRHITSNWRARYNEFLIFTSPETKALIERKGIRLIGYKQLAMLWRR